MQIPAETKPAVYGAFGGAIVLAIVGFSWAGWVTGATAEQTAKLRSNAAVIAALSPICVQKFQQEANANDRLVELKKVSSWQQGDFISKGGWATMPGSTAPNLDVAKACAVTLNEAKT
ncbi:MULTISPECIES: hypothetical protein [unclassified Beijerinckia]|uniref:hypothetical protein n=1 Tax=unclassified Beijerinckia TaxID=2638183 RepID=UPI000895184B|nr:MULTISPECIES: hypothetical protein [unclassified Beijerinckia]MDH7797553.1 hypothetical protein [Beijerinckia sp. GAS462]SEC90206.1 hypothetical protein SAMN05443249_3847 [Beijerinckia sp. 28-YEA-48]